ncbi:MAG: hypothetical protein ACHQ53_18800 [Polyangiales bacterium]
MSTKAEHESGSGERPAEHPEAPPTPSIIVDPELARARPSNGGGPVTPAVPAPDEAAANAMLSAAEAERFAASFRPSWEPAAPVAGLGATSQPSVPAARITTPLPQEPVHEHEPDLDVSIVPGARERKRAMFITVGAVAGFLLLGVLALMSSRATPPSKARPEAKPEPAEIAKAAPAPEAPTPPSAAQVAVPPVPVPTPQPTPVPEAPPVGAAAQGTAPASPSLAMLAGAPPVENAAAAELVRIQVSATPSETDLSLDDAKIANPYDGRAPKGGKHVLRAEAEGYHSREITLRFDHDRSITLELDKRKAPKPSHPAAAHAAPPPPPPARLVIRPKPAAAPPTAPRPKKGAGFVSESPY